MIILIRTLYRTKSDQIEKKFDNINKAISMHKLNFKYVLDRNKFVQESRFKYVLFDDLNNLLPSATLIMVELTKIIYF